MPYCPALQHLAAISLLALVSSSAFAVAGGPYGPYLGKLAGKEIVLSINGGDTAKEAAGNYFYRNIGLDITLFQAAGKDQFIECPATWADEVCSKPSGYWNITFTDDAAKALWRKTPSSKPLQVDLVKAPADTRPASAKATDSTTDRWVEALRVAAPVATGKEEKNGTVRWHIVTDKRSGVHMPLLTVAPNAAAMAKINATLTKYFNEQVSSALYAQARPNGDFDEENAVYFANERYFAIGGGAGGYSGGAHPQFGFGVRTYDLQTGDPVEFERFYRVAPATKTAFNVKTDKSLVAQALKQYITEDKAPAGEDNDCWAAVAARYDCKDAQCTGSNDKSYAQVFPTKEGLGIVLDVYSEAERPCRAEYRTLPWKEANRALLKQGSFP
ncbi:hypothetical protein ACO0LO_18175 [Undibacterium sp. TJN25]|uniref:hypothetical protein n=1 Tax=Undibacterium sp. TJN25 TaxID=3413056 RepID=UPI003BF22FB0